MVSEPEILARSCNFCPAILLIILVIYPSSLSYLRSAVVVSSLMVFGVANNV